MKVRVGIATMLGERPLERAMKSLAPQVDEIVVYHDDGSRLGPAGKFLAAVGWSGLYLTCDDDIWYPPHYVFRLAAEMKRWGSGIVATAWGRTYPERPGGFTDWLGEGSYAAAVPEARWVNWAGTGALAFVPSVIGLPTWRDPRNEEAEFNAWAQRQRIPIYLIQRPANWPVRIPCDPAAPTLYKDAKAESFAKREAELRDAVPWRVWTPDTNR